jgi:chromosome segregation ATPase
MPNLKIGIKEHDFLRKIIIEKYQQEKPNWSPVGNLNNYDHIAKNIRSKVKKRNDSLSVSAYQMQKLFTYHGESTYREDFIEACYLYCEAKRDANALRDEESEVPSAPKTVAEELDFLKWRLQETENRAEELQKEVDHLIEQNIQIQAQKADLGDLEAQLAEKQDFIKSLNQKIAVQNRQNETLEIKLSAYEKQLLFTETKLSEQDIALQYYTNSLQNYKIVVQQNLMFKEKISAYGNLFQDYQTVVQQNFTLKQKIESYAQLSQEQETVVQENHALKQIIEDLKRRFQATLKKQKNRWIMSVFVNVLLLALVLYGWVIKV